ncbi:hypothetical protein C7B64_14190 [Merismopedia glauca CCAP 1448/3]|uniref:Uncharacterized protein n=1 Tax=Merismopedia glauca CCAP 1448/3 TaxID=1296344 RepID=A0A2T1C1X6_9CYAN|nr:hypothetical protein C7B64_14190 [Merismopedia glauca CCAP 1448/3]
MLVIFWGLIQLPIGFVSAQIGNTEGVSQQVYGKLPNIPLENQYISRETGKAAAKNTLVARLIRYHVFVKGRSPISRLDWKLTVADYLGANEFQEESVYPGYDSLKTNALKGDRAVINQLSRSDRDRLIAILLESFGKGALPNTPQPTASPSPSVPNPRPSLTLPQPGDAQLLKP